jgi:hypothetical protein
MFSVLNEALLDSNQSDDGRKQIKLVRKIFDNLVEYPLEAKFQRLPYTRLQSKLSGSWLQLLVAAGFVQTGDALIYSPDADRRNLIDLLDLIDLESEAMSRKQTESSLPTLTLEWSSSFERFLSERIMLMQRLDMRNYAVSREELFESVMRAHSSERDRATSMLTTVCSQVLAQSDKSFQKSEIFPSLAGCPGAVPLLQSLGFRVAKTLFFVEIGSEASTLANVRWLASELTKRVKIKYLRLGQIDILHLLSSCLGAARRCFGA